MPYERSTQDKALQGATYAGAGIGIWLCFLYYPVWVIGIQCGLDTEENVMQGAIAGIITLVAIWLLQWGCRKENPTCALLLIGLFVACLVPAFQYIFWLMGDYSDSIYEATFPGFNWFWFIPTADNELWNWGILGEAVWDWLEMAFWIAVITYSICGVILLFSWMRNK